MDSPQYLKTSGSYTMSTSFKPYYKWIVLNTMKSINVCTGIATEGFKPYYKWIVLNTS